MINNEVIQNNLLADHGWCDQCGWLTVSKTPVRIPIKKKDTLRIDKLLKLLNSFLCFLLKVEILSKKIDTEKCMPSQIVRVMIKMAFLLSDYSPPRQVSQASLHSSPQVRATSGKIGRLHLAQPCDFAGKNRNSSSQKLLVNWSRYATFGIICNTARQSMRRVIKMVFLLSDCSPRPQVSQASLLAMDSSLVKRFARLLSVQVIEIIEKIVKHECEELASYWSRYTTFGIICNAASQTRSAYD